MADVQSKVAYVSDTDKSDVFDALTIGNVMRIGDDMKNWIFAGGKVEFPKTISFQVSDRRIAQMI